MAATVQTVYLVCRSVPQGEEHLGAIVDPAELSRLEGDESAMPIDTYLREAVGARVGDEVLVLGEPRVRTALPVWTVDGYHANAAERDATIASLSSAVRKAVGISADWEPEAAVIARRTAEAKDARTKAEAAALEPVELAEVKR